MSRLAIPVLMLALLAGCAGLRVDRGLPEIAKSPNGMLVSGSAGLPDLNRGNQERLSGRFADAIHDLLPLASRGYPEAQLSLGSVYEQQESAAAQAEAIRWYRAALARRPDAAVPLARVVMHRGDWPSLLEAHQLLLQAEAKLADPEISAALLELYGQFPVLDTQGRAPALASAAALSPVPDLLRAGVDWYRASLDGVGNANRLVDLCRRNLDLVPACYADLATYYRYSGRHAELATLVTRAIATLHAGATPDELARFDYDPLELPLMANRLATALVDPPEGFDLTVQADDVNALDESDELAQTQAAEAGVDALAEPGAIPQVVQPATAADATGRVSDAANSGPHPGSAEPELASQLLRWMLAQPGALPTEAAGVAVTYGYLLPDADLEALLKAQAAHGSVRATLYLGQLYGFSPRSPREALLAEASLLRTLDTRDTAALGHYALGRLYQQGYLGRPDPQRALEHFLYAARRRLSSADTRLAHLYYDTPGVAINRVYCYVFARLASDAGHPVTLQSIRNGSVAAIGLLERLRSELTAAEFSEAEAIYHAERDVHLVARPPVPPDIWVKQAG